MKSKENLLGSKSIISSLIISIVFLLPLVFTWTLMDSFFIPKKVLLESFVAIILVVWLSSVVSNKDTKQVLSIKVTPLTKVILIFLLWSLLTVLKSPNIEVSLGKYLFLIERVFLFFVVLAFIDTSKKLNRLLYALLASAFIVSILGILQYYGLDISDKMTFTQRQRLGDKYSIFSTLGHPNFMGAFLISVLPVSFAHCITVKGYRKFIYVLLFFISSFCLYISRSKGAWLGCIISFSLMGIWLVYIYKDVIKLRKKVIAASAALLILAFASFFFISAHLSPDKTSPLKEVTKTLSIDFGANRARLIIWQTAFMMIKNSPVTGLGYGTFYFYYQHYQGEFLAQTKYLDYYLTAYRPGKEAHNDYLHIFAETGLIGIGLFLFIIILFLKKGFELLKKAPDNNQKVITLSMICGTVAILGHSLVSFPLQQVPPGSIIWIFMGVVMGLPFRHELDMMKSGWIIKKFQNPFFKFDDKKKRAIQMLFLLTTVGYLFNVFKPVYGSILHKKAYNLMFKQDFLNAANTLENASYWYPNNSDIHLMLGASYHNLGYTDKAANEYETSFNLNPDYMILYNLALLAKRKHDDQKMEDYLLRAIKLHPDLIEGYEELADIYKRRGEMDKYMKYYARWMELGALKK